MWHLQPLGVEHEEVSPKPIHGCTKYLEDFKKPQDTLWKILLDKIKQSQSKQKHCHNLRNRMQRRKGFTIGRTVLLKNFIAGGLNKKYIGPYLVIGVNGTNCEIELLANKKIKLFMETI